MMKCKLVKLNNGVEMPSLGLGTWPMKRVLYKVVPLALLAGYRAFDTSASYGNEHYLGRVLPLFSRKKIFVTSKLGNAGQRTGDVRSELMNTLSRLNLKNLDLYLMHWPNPETFLDSWKQMEQLYRESLVRAIGVCNFHQHHLEQLLEVASVVPALNQFELHPLLTQEPLVEFCRSKGIAVQAYSPLARMDKKLIQQEVLQSIATKYDKAVTQIVLRWIVQSGYATCPKSSNYQRLLQNIDLFDFELSESEMAEISGLNENYRVRHNPDTVDFSKV
jgi:diketogulonate reductase-like aldo/keto reductase